jgi:hypothetical protein
MLQKGIYKPRANKSKSRWLFLVNFSFSHIELYCHACVQPLDSFEFAQGKGFNMSYRIGFAIDIMKYETPESYDHKTAQFGPI